MSDLGESDIEVKDLQESQDKAKQALGNLEKHFVPSNEELAPDSKKKKKNKKKNNKNSPTVEKQEDTEKKETESSGKGPYMSGALAEIESPVDKRVKDWSEQIEDEENEEEHSYGSDFSVSRLEKDLIDFAETGKKESLHRNAQMDRMASEIATLKAENVSLRSQTTEILNEMSRMNRKIDQLLADMDRMPKGAAFSYNPPSSVGHGELPHIQVTTTASSQASGFVFKINTGYDDDE